MSTEEKKDINDTEKVDQRIKEQGAVICENGEKRIECVSIIGQIEGHFILPDNQKTTKYEHMIPLLAQIEQDEAIDGMLLILNTVGGDVEAGLAIAEMIASMKKPTVSLVLGGGHSIGVPLAVCCKRSFIVKSATMTLHPVRINGLVVGAPQTYHYFEKMQERITDFVSENSKCPKEKISALMMKTDEIATDMGSIIDGTRAVEIGLIDEIGGLHNALCALDDMIRNE